MSIRRSAGHCPRRTSHSRDVDSRDSEYTRAQGATMRRLALLCVMATMIVAAAAGEVNADLLRAAREGDVETIQDLLNRHGPEIAEANSGVAAIKAAAEQGHTEAIRALLASPVVDSEKAVSTAGCGGGNVRVHRDRARYRRAFWQRAS